MAEMSTKKQGIIVLVLLIAAGVGYYLWTQPSNEDIGRNVASLLQNQMDSKEPLSSLHMKVEGVDVIHAEGNKYSGVAHVSLNGTTHDVGVDIVADRDQVMMQVPPGGFMFIAPELAKKFQQGVQ